MCVCVHVRVHLRKEEALTANAWQHGPCTPSSPCLLTHPQCMHPRLMFYSDLAKLWTWVLSFSFVFVFLLFTVLRDMEWQIVRLSLTGETYAQGRDQGHLYGDRSQMPLLSSQLHNSIIFIIIRVPRRAGSRHADS